MAEEARSEHGDEAREAPETPENTIPSDAPGDTPGAQDADGALAEAPEEAGAGATPVSEGGESGAPESSEAGFSLDNAESGEPAVGDEPEILEEVTEATSEQSLLEELAAQRAAAKALAEAERQASREFAAESPLSDDEVQAAAAEAAAAAALKESLTASGKSAGQDFGAGASLLEVSDDQAKKARKSRATKAKKAAEAARDIAGDDEELDEAPVEPLIRPVPDDGVCRRWYAIHAHSGQEGSVKRMLEAKAEQEGLRDQLANVFVPMEEVAEIRSGEKKVSKRKFFPGYVLVQLPEHPERHADLWHLIRETTGVTGFIGSRSVPVPLEDSEVNAIIEEIRGERERPKPKINFEKEERVKIIDGPFANFIGTIDEINSERGTLKVLVEIFERLTSVEVEFWQVEHI